MLQERVNEAARQLSLDPLEGVVQSRADEARAVEPPVDDDVERGELLELELEDGCRRCRSTTGP